jgi:ABC-2 type transport system ATP-binding protein
MDDVMIRIEHLSKSFGRHQVLDDLSLNAGKGERVALIGANGAGKTTLIRCLLGEYTCEGGVWIDGKAPRAARRDVLRRVGFVPQVPPALRMPAGQLIRFAAEISDGDASRIEDVSAKLGLEARAVWRKPFFKLSGGQKQKLLIAIALGRETDVLVLDEPAANLDPEGRDTFFNLLFQRESDGVTLLSSHRLDEAAPLVTRVVELDGGRVVLDEPMST